MAYNVVSKADKVSPSVFKVLTSNVEEVYHQLKPKGIPFISTFDGFLIAFILVVQFNFSIDINALVHQYASIVKFALSVEFLKQRIVDQLLRFELLAKRNASYSL